MKQDLSAKKEMIDFGNDSIVVRKFINGILGGVMLDYTDFAERVILAGHCVITDGNGNYKPMPTKGDSYDKMPEGFHYAGVVYRSVRVGEPVSVMYRGVVNKYKLPYDLKSDFKVFGIIVTCDLDETDPYQDYKSYDNIEDIPTGNAARTASVNLSKVINDFSGTQYFSNVLVADAEVDKNVTLKALNTIDIDNIVLGGEKGANNGKIIFAAKRLNLKNITVKNDSTFYNAFEGAGSTDADYKGIEKVVAENLDIDCPSITHNIINVYTPANGAEIIVRNCKFNLTVDNSNVLRLANYLNSENVKVTFENCEWTYENGVSFGSWPYAGLIIYQPAGGDAALGGNTSKFATWKFTFKNCKYNGQKVTENNFGEHNQVFYTYNIGGNSKVEDPTEKVEGLRVTFE